MIGKIIGHIVGHLIVRIVARIIGYRPQNRLRFHYGIGSGIGRVILSDVLSVIGNMHHD